MKNILLIDDGNPIAKEIESLCLKNKYSIELFRDGKNDFKIAEINSNQSNFCKKLQQKKYDGMIIAPMYFSYDGDVIKNGDVSKEFDKMVGINLKMPAILMSMGTNYVKKSGTIINLLSTDYQWGSFVSKNYSAIMQAKKSLVKSYANMLGKNRIRVNAVAAGWTENVIEGTMEKKDNDFKTIKSMDKKIVKYTPLSRKGSVTEIAEIFIFLLSKEASYINGQSIQVDGGYGNVDVVTKCEYETGDFL